jgi:dTDP-4-dehydrorhamnose 3,5-epimerase
MNIAELSISGSWVFTPDRFQDIRGQFHEVFKLSALQSELDYNFEVKQVNQSVSRSGVIRGVHWADVPPGQAKYVFCPKGAIWDVVVDLRVGSPSFGKFDAVEISEENGKSVLIGEGLGHAFLSLKDNTVVNYLCSEPFSPNSEHGINPLDPDLDIPFRRWLGDGSFVISDKDIKSPNLKELISRGSLPEYI